MTRSRRRNRESSGQRELIASLREMVNEQNSTIMLQSQLISTLSERIDANREANRKDIDEIKNSLGQYIRETIAEILDRHPLNQLADWLRVFLSSNRNNQCRDLYNIFSEIKFLRDCLSHLKGLIP